MSHPYEPTPTSVAAEALDVLKSLPTFEETQAQVQAVMNEIADAAARIIPSARWETPHEGSGMGCERPYEQSGGRSYFLPILAANHITVSEPDWAQILDAAATAAAKLGATEKQVMRDSPGDHDVRFFGPAGVSVGIGFEKSLVVTGYTGCRLPR